MPRGAQVGAMVVAAELMALPGARSSVLLSSLTAEGLDDLLRSASFTQFPAHDVISPPHAPDDALHVLVRGAAIQQSWASAGGAEHFARPVAAGEVIGLTDVLSGEPVMRETRALMATTTVRIPGPAVRGLLETSPVVATGLARVAAHVLRASEMDQVVLATGDALARVTHRLLELVAGWGAPGERGVEVTLPLTQAQLGAWAGVSRETTVKCLQWLRSRDLIHTSRRHIAILDVPALERLAGRRGGGATVRLRTGRRSDDPRT